MRISVKHIVAGTIVVGAILSAGSAFAETTTGSDMTGVPTPAATMTARKTVDIACMGTAVATREAAISSAFSAKSSAVSAAFTTRTSALVSAWAITTAKDRNAAIKAAWKAFNAAATTARKTYRAANLAAWKAFRTGAKACHGSAAQDAAAQSVDSNL